uniref:Uncharacterized protein n=1 Tax=Ciona savignyi TaxID=51511 RepID=H2ZNV2_CIOSA
KIGTHNGTFHCDEVLACYLLKLLPRYKDAEVVRTRDMDIIEKCDIVVDVGGIHDHERCRYDHHQRTFAHTMNSLRPEKTWTTKLSSAGLVYCHYGEEILAAVMGEKGRDEKTVSIIYDKKLFEDAMTMVGKEFEDCVHGYVDAWLPARDIVVKAVNQRFEVSDAGLVIVLDQFCPWKEHLLNLEDEGFVKNGEILYVLYEDNAQKWRIQCVPAGRNTFENRLSLLADWRGLRDDELSKVSGIAGCVFVHASGFIGGNATRDGALNMA